MDVMKIEIDTTDAVGNMKSLTQAAGIAQMAIEKLKGSGDQFCRIRIVGGITVIDISPVAFTDSQ